MKIVYYLNEDRKRNLYCRISDGEDRVTFSLDYVVGPKMWDARKQELSDMDAYQSTLHSLKYYLTKKFHELKSEGKTEIVSILKNEALTLMNENGIEGITENLFNQRNEGNGVPSYKEFLQAFEKFSGLKKGQYKTEIIEATIYFHTDKMIYEMDTYEGMKALLKSIIDDRLYDDLGIRTEESIWSSIYVDDSIEKHIFLPKMLTEWEIYWNTKYREIGEKMVRTDHLDELKQSSWRTFQVFMSCYDGHSDVIALAGELDDQVLYPISVLAMLRIFNAETCYDEYCELEFFAKEDWESISLEEDGNDGPMFFIRPSEIKMDYHSMLG